MKRLLLLAASFFLLMGMSAQERRADGTGYERKVVVEELTGTACGWCPRGLVGMKMLRDLYGDRFIGVAAISSTPPTQCTRPTMPTSTGVMVALKVPRAA